MYNDIAITVTLLNRGLCEGVFQVQTGNSLCYMNIYSITLLQIIPHYDNYCKPIRFFYYCSNVEVTKIVFPSKFYLSTYRSFV